MDAREIGPMLRFMRDYRGKHEVERIIFCHEHERSWHYPISIWKIISRVIKTRFFWTSDFGNVVSGTYITTSFNRDRTGEICTVTTGVGSWIRMSVIVEFLFENTSISRESFKHPIWKTPCCSTFFIDPEILLKRTREEYDSILDRIHWLASHPEAGIWQEATNHTRFSAKDIAHNAMVGWVVERSWTMLLTGKAEAEMNISLGRDRD
jgi:hypothetical protein